MNSYKIFNKIIQDDNYEIMYVISLKVASLYGLLNRNKVAFNILNEANKKYDDKTIRELKQIYAYQKNKIKYCMHLNDMALLLNERLKLEKILRESNENQKALVRECISIGYTYLEMQNKEKCLEYLTEAEKISEINEDIKSLTKLQQHKAEIINKDDDADNDDESFNKIYDEEEK